MPGGLCNHGPKRLSGFSESARRRLQAGIGDGKHKTFLPALALTPKQGSGRDNRLRSRSSVPFFQRKCLPADSLYSFSISLLGSLCSCSEDRSSLTCRFASARWFSWSATSASPCSTRVIITASSASRRRTSASENVLRASSRFPSSFAMFAKWKRLSANCRFVAAFSC